MVYDNVLEAMGHTPLIRSAAYSRRELRADSREVRSAQRRRLNQDAYGVQHDSPGRAARRNRARQDHHHRADERQQGIGLALVGAVRGYDVRIIMPDSVSVERRKICEAYGAQIELVHDDGDIGKAIETCAELAREQAAADPNAFMPDQFSNVDNVAIQRTQTAVEILEVSTSPASSSTASPAALAPGGSISGIGSALKHANPDTVVWAAEPENAAMLAGGNIARICRWASATASSPPSSTAASSMRPA